MMSRDTCVIAGLCMQEQEAILMQQQPQQPSPTEMLAFNQRWRKWLCLFGLCHQQQATATGKKTHGAAQIAPSSHT